MGMAFWVGFGGFCGSVLRYFLSGLVHEWTGRDDFPVGTIAVNVLGCFVMGVVSFIVEVRGAFSPEVRAFIIVGILGGFTTFSAFGNETLNLCREGESFLALVNVLAQVLLGLGAVWLGRVLGHVFWG
jgi:CrcB protein